MMAIGPVEPGEDTYDHEATPPRSTRPGPRRFRRTTLAATTAAIIGAAAITFYVTRPEPPPPPPTPWPSQSVSVTYEGDMSRPRAGDRTFTFAVAFAQESGPPATVRRVGQPSTALSVSTSPLTPFEVKTGSPRKLIITMHIRECGEVPRNAGLPFLEVTLRNVLAMEKQSYILGPEYANDLSAALTAACP
ncbi:Tat pathway signal sequence domain protein [Streptomyces venezuelae]|uniref:Tat pathway signal sequence domain protein n=1 Tax=Streptomyces venezuelae TaxID=54571 RepID=A0A5P2CVQ4_STRVZ|nr:Tat pathway signal sequence domain protein [Streptomyces venezuelae]QES45838.1 Tat pathway signal sequence domain protein [Streptomyces venezuelae]